MKYNSKTAIRVIREEDKTDLIPFFEAIKADCNKLEPLMTQSDIKIGNVWYIHPKGYLTASVNEQGFSRFCTIFFEDYTMLFGIPQNWREEMKLPHEKLVEDTTELEMLKTEVSMLESENKDLRERNNELENFVVRTLNIVDNITFPTESELKDLTEKAKQLLK